MAIVHELETGDEFSWSPESEDTRVPCALHHKKLRVPDISVSYCMSKLYHVYRLVGRCPESWTLGYFSSILYFMFSSNSFICEWRPDVIWEKGSPHRSVVQSVLWWDQRRRSSLCDSILCVYCFISSVLDVSFVSHCGQQPWCLVATKEKLKEKGGKD